MTDADVVDGPRRRTAFLLNLFFPPVGYFYAGMPWIGLLCSVALMGCGIWTLVLKVSRPDKFDHLPADPLSLVFAAVCLIPIGLVTGLHAAFRHQPRRGRGAGTWIFAWTLDALGLGMWSTVQIVG